MKVLFTEHTFIHSGCHPPLHYLLSTLYNIIMLTIESCNMQKRLC